MAPSTMRVTVIGFAIVLALRSGAMGQNIKGAVQAFSSEALSGKLHQSFEQATIRKELPDAPKILTNAWNTMARPVNLEGLEFRQGVDESNLSLDQRIDRYFPRANTKGTATTPESFIDWSRPRPSGAGSGPKVSEDRDQIRKDFNTLQAALFSYTENGAKRKRILSIAKHRYLAQLKKALEETSMTPEPSRRKLSSADTPYRRAFQAADDAINDQFWQELPRFQSVNMLAARALSSGRLQEPIRYDALFEAAKEVTKSAEKSYLEYVNRRMDFNRWHDLRDSTKDSLVERVVDKYDEVILRSGTGLSTQPGKLAHQLLIKEIINAREIHQNSHANFMEYWEKLLGHLESRATTSNKVSPNPLAVA